MTITDKVCPNLVGVDIGCGIVIDGIEAYVVPMGKKYIDM